jgi:hypothetical protein
VCHLLMLEQLLLQFLPLLLLLPPSSQTTIPARSTHMHHSYCAGWHAQETGAAAAEVAPHLHLAVNASWKTARQNCHTDDVTQMETT